jgi:hypothetical protein
MSNLVRHLRGNFVAYLALFMSLGGTTYAAATLPANSVGAKQLKKNAVLASKIRNGAVTEAKIADNTVTGARVKDDSLTGADILESSLGKVPSATAADTAANATQALDAENAKGALFALNADALGGLGPDAYEKVPTTTQYFTIPATALVDADGQNRANVFVVNSVRGTEQWCTKSGGDPLQAAVNLPQGATIVSEAVDYEDDPGTTASNGTVSLTRMPFFAADGWYADIFSDSMVNIGNPPGAPGTFFDQTPAPDTNVVDNSQYTYTMISTPIAGAAVCAIQIGYTVPPS